MRSLKFIVLALTCLFFPFEVKAYQTEAVMHIQIFQAAGAGDVRTLTKLLSAGYDINARDSYGDTTICRAVLQGHHKAYDVLLAYGADPKPRCMRRIPYKIQDTFMQNHYQPAFIKGNEMAVYTSVKDNPNAHTPTVSVSPPSKKLLWGTLGVVAVGGGIALAAGGGGGGGGGVIRPWENLNPERTPSLLLY